MKRFISLLLLVVSILPMHAGIMRTDSIMPEDSVVTDTIADNTDLQLSLPDRLRQLLDNDIFERTQVGIYVYDLTADTLVFTHNERQCMRPASNEKLVTAIVALNDLGVTYNYQTRLYADHLPSDTDSVFVGRVYVRGGYDPLIDADDLRAFAQSLKAHGITRITSPIGLDLSMKDDKRMGWGWCWDDDCVPLTPLLYRNHDSFADNLRRIFREEGIDWDGTTEERTVPSDATLVCTRTRNIDQVLLPMLKNSNNSAAESLFYQLAAQGGKPRAGRKQAVAHYNALFRHIGLEPSHYQIADGSGLSLYNYLTPEAIGRLLRYAYNDDDIYRHLHPALPIAGEDGTLRKRMRHSAAEGNVHAKTGTVEGVSTLSGYLTTATGNVLCFSIMNQGVRYSSTGRNFQDRVCRALCR
ncbi:D-alanyl-D-alanine carboxypeptidase/D-alanyl-D-alanine endopeptidase [Prevotellamassilia timonensis]|uniref:D-alanyl-D-alanine carboxypeptidase/D-alanyl-D-alanine endopeptidase n=1 Tax=Prevotellamassilia timonensis TaxID=1852370 RepID=UPI00307B0CD5